MGRHKCVICGYVYDPDLGDEIGGIEPGVPFSDLPVDYTCPVCGGDKDVFLKYD